MFLPNKQRKKTINTRIEKVKNSNYMHKIEIVNKENYNVTERFK